MVASDGQSNLNSANIIQCLIWAMLALIISAFVVYGLYFYLFQAHQNNYEDLQSSRWAPYNVSMATFTKPDDFSRSEQYLSELIWKDRTYTNPIPAYLLGKLYQISNRNREALAQYQNVIRISQNGLQNQLNDTAFVNDALAEMAKIRYAFGQPRLALADIRQISDLDKRADKQLLTAIQDAITYPAQADTHFTLAKAYRSELLFSQARAELATAEKLSHDPDTLNKIRESMAELAFYPADINPYARYFTLAGIQQELKTKPNLYQAAQYYENALTYEPDFQWANQSLAVIYKSQNQLPLSKSHALRAVSQNPQSYIGYMTLGEIAQAEQSYSEGIQYFNHARDILSQRSDKQQTSMLSNVENQLAFSYELLKDNNNALMHYQKAYNTAKLTLASAIKDPQNAQDLNEDMSYAKESMERIQSAIAETHTADNTVVASTPDF